MDAATSSPPPTHLCYHVRESDALPLIDCHLSIKRVLFPSIAAQQRINWVLYRIKTLSSVLLLVAIICNCLHFLVKKEIGQIMGIGSIKCGILPIASGLIAMRYDMVRLLTHSYEFVYVTTIQFLAVVLVGTIYGDLRMLSAVTATLANQVAVMIDATSSTVAKRVIVSCTSPISFAVYVVYLSFRLIDGFVPFSVYSRGDWTLDSADLLLNALATIGVIVGRNSYRRRKQTQNHTKNEPAIHMCRCVTYLTRLEYVQGPYVPQSWQTRTRTMSTSPSVSQLRLVPLLGTIDAGHIVSRTLTGRGCSTSLYPRSVRWCLHVTAIAGVGCSLGGVTGLVTSNPYAYSLSVVSLAATCTYCTVCFLHCNTVVVKRLVTTFDFLFFMLQVTGAYLCIAYMYHWDRRSVAVLSSWVWFVWIVTADALMPVMKRKLGITRKLTLCVMIVQVVIILVLFVGIVFVDLDHVENRVIYETVVFHRHVVWRALPFLFARMVTVCPWSLRLLWRIWWSRNTTLLMIQGAVEYEDKVQTMRARQVPIPSTEVSPPVTEPKRLACPVTRVHPLGPL